MSRFSNLEFDGTGERLPSRPERERDDLRVLHEARIAFENAEFESALRLCSKAIEFNPHQSAAWAGQVRALIELGEYSEANLWADKALERFPGETEIIAAKGVALARLGQFDEALALSDISVQQSGDTPYVWLARGDVLLARQESVADFCFDKALMLDAANWVHRWLAARIRAFYRQFAVALKLVQQALELRADHPILWMMAGECQRELGLLGAARNSFTQALQLDPACLQARHFITAMDGSGVGTRLAGWWRRQFHR
jgi:tetratricopeptide (TPR) repeat protein